MRRETPNHLDPLGEPTINRRIWAAYLKAGFTRAAFARELGMSYQTLDRWDTGEVMPSLELVMLAASKLGYTVDQLCYGHRAPVQSVEAAPVQSVETREMITRLEKLQQQLQALQQQLRVAEYERAVAMAQLSLRAPHRERRDWVVVVIRQADRFQGIMAQCG